MPGRAPGGSPANIIVFAARRASCQGVVHPVAQRSVLCSRGRPVGSAYRAASLTDGRAIEVLVGRGDDRAIEVLVGRVGDLGNGPCGLLPVDTYCGGHFLFWHLFHRTPFISSLLSCDVQCFSEGELRLFSEGGLRREDTPVTGDILCATSKAQHNIYSSYFRHKLDFCAGFQML